MPKLLQKFLTNKIYAKILGANALLGRRYFQTTGSEHSNAGNGTQPACWYSLNAKDSYSRFKGGTETAWHQPASD